MTGKKLFLKKMPKVFDDESYMARERIYKWKLGRTYDPKN